MARLSSQTPYSVFVRMAHGALRPGMPLLGCLPKPLDGFDFILWHTHTRSIAELSFSAGRRNSARFWNVRYRSKSCFNMTFSLPLADRRNAREAPTPFRT